MSVPTDQIAEMSIEDKGKQPKQAKQQNKGKGKGKGKGPAPVPEFIKHRIEVFDRILARQADEPKPEPVPIKVTVLPSGDVVEGVAGEVAPIQIAKDRGLAADVCTCKVDGELRDLQVPLVADCTVEFFDFKSPEGQHVFWHSSAHILGQALEKKYGCLLTIGPALEQGYYYDCSMEEKDGEAAAIPTSDFKDIESVIARVIKDKQPFVKLVVTKEEALDMFRENKFKVRLINDKVPDGETCTVYRCGQLVDLCRGPHLTNTSRVKASMVSKASAAYWLGDAANESLQRVYGISFPDKELLKEHKELLAEAAKRDHRVVGGAQELFFAHPLSPGSAFFLPHGARIYNTLLDFMKAQYKLRGFDEVMSPNLFDAELWKTSGHWQNYKDNMFSFMEGSGPTAKEYGLKPMNCPGHCLMYAHRQRSYRELPVRFADFGALHRNEASGALTGLIRVRRFQQDDAHIFCRRDQIEGEMQGALDFVKYVYGIFGFKFRLVLSTRPEKYMGAIEDWDLAENNLREALDTGDWDWSINEGDGAFYGPKIDMYITDALKREHQCATVQLDFQLPKNFNLSFMTDSAEHEGGKDRPVMIHRAIYGSFERFFAVLIEHTGGKWPFWISPRQGLVVPISNKFNDYAVSVRDKLHAAGFYVDADVSDRKMQKKVREGQLAQYNYILVVGQEEMDAGTVNIRTRDNVVHGAKSIDDLIGEWKENCEKHV